MELLSIKHRDFEMTIECGKFEGIWRKASTNVGEAHLTSAYTWSEGVESVTLLSGDDAVALQHGEKAQAVFFDNADYPIWVDFKPGVTKAEFGSMLKSENESFSFRRGILTGFLNYGNDIGRSEISIAYVMGGERRSFSFGFEVLSTKLNYHEHWRQIIDDIEREYRMLTIDYMRRTFHGFSVDPQGDRPEIVWWSIFAGEQEKFIRAVRSIIDRPRHRLHSMSAYQRADKLKRVPACMENELAEHRREPGHLYHIEVPTLSNDTLENRFLKHALKEVSEKYGKLKKSIEALKNVSERMQEEMDTTQAALKQLLHNPFFRTVGRFKGFHQESLVLQKATGYAQVYRTWNLLRRAYSLHDGIYRLQTKDIATLYEIWCFIEVSHIVKEQLMADGRWEDVEMDHRNRMEMNGIFTWELGKGEHSRILFKHDGVELAELIYNPKHTDKENDTLSIQHLVVPTVAQKPDIVLQLTKNDLEKGMKMTYLFDAKYRIDGRSNNVDVPPEDAINQMHRYRDAIYYQAYGSNVLKKEVIGGYILFPGDGEPADVEVSKFYQSIDRVNIGAFPLRPKDERNRRLLQDFIHSLIGKQSVDIVAQVIPQKGVFTEVSNRALVGIVKPSNRR
ncbi:MAG: DUF2357 domain-containing protein, partial [Bacteroidales bacterium]|nr:DUF2357 domain-containing protein [Bacteroidales bacterium]